MYTFKPIKDQCHKGLVYSNEYFSSLFAFKKVISHIVVFRIAALLNGLP